MTSVYDLMVAMSRLARGDASTAIGANMHIAGAAVMTRLLHRARAAHEDAMVAALSGLLQQAAAGRVLLCFPSAERGTDLATPMTEATPSNGGYVLNGRKIFATNSPKADLFFPSVRVPDGSGGYLIGNAIVPRETPGLDIDCAWDLLGMRGSGSNDIIFDNCALAAQQLYGLRDDYGRADSGSADFALIANLPLTSVFIGIAEAARAFAVAAAKTQRRGPERKLLCDRISIQQIIAEIEIDLTACVLCPTPRAGGRSAF